MFIDARALDDGTVIDAEVCVIGGGVAGITLALEFEKLGIDTCVLESGGFDSDRATRDLNRGESAGIPYRFADGQRSRFLGGSSNCWGGWSRPLDEHDFEVRDWVPHSGWPIARRDLESHYARAHGVLKLGPLTYDAAFWEAAIGRRDVRRVPLTAGKVVDVVSQFSPPVRMGVEYRRELERARHVRIYLYANAVELQTDRPAQRVERVRLATLSGRRHTARARLFVLAGGGIENPRLMLLSNAVEPAGLGNGHDLVGRYFMDHPRILSGSIKFRREWSRNKLYDVKFNYQSRAVSAHGTGIATQFVLTPQAQRAERLLNGQVWVSSVFPGDGSAAGEALVRLKHFMESKDQPDWSPLRDFVALLRQPVDTAGFVITRYAHPRALVKEVKFQASIEPEPDPDARVTLSDARDALGLNRVRVAWRLSPLVRRTFDRHFALVAEEFERNGIATVRLDAPLEGRDDWPGLSDDGSFHHMGTTRMDDSPRRGVVDRNCRVHGIGNLYVGGSSVFPTGGANFPTITIVALSLRLAEHLAQELADRPAALAA